MNSDPDTVIPFPKTPGKRLKIGCSVPMNLFADASSKESRGLLDAFGSRENLLARIARYADCAELRSVSGTTLPETVLSAARALAEAGLACTVHASLADVSPENPERFFAPYVLLLASGMQEEYNLTVHPLPDFDDTVRVLSSLCRYAGEQRYPVRLALENQRFSTPEREGTGSCRTVEEIVSAVSSPLLGICFDFGHQRSNFRKRGADADPVTDGFLTRAVHTHIHALYEGTTHFPLTMGETALEENLSGLILHGYSGVLSLELESPRFAGKAEFVRAYTDSLRMLRTAEGHIRRKLEAEDWYRAAYPQAVRAGLAALTKESSAVLPLAPALYLLHVGRKKIAIDPALWTLPLTEEGKETLVSALSTADAVVLTHDHADHCDPALLSLLADRIGRFYLPDFLADRLIEKANLRPETVVSVREGEEYVFGDIRLRFFESAHMALREYGFCLQYGEKTLLFPTDVRSYPTAVEKLPRFPGAVLFAHVWLAREEAMNPAEYETAIPEYRDFLASADASRILFGHLCDVRRPAGDMWSDIHTDAVCDGTDLSGTLLLPGEVCVL